MGLDSVPFPCYVLPPALQKQKGNLAARAGLASTKLN